MIEAILNPYPLSHLTGKLYNALSDQEWHSEQSLKEMFAANGYSPRLVNARVMDLKKAGLMPTPPAYPLGQWQIMNRRGQVCIRFNDKVEGAGIDEAALGKMVSEAVSNKVSDFVKSALEFHTKEHMQMLTKQIEELKKSSVPILELQRYEGTKKTVETVEPAHEMMQYLLYLLNHGDHVYLYDGKAGGAGSGKTTAAIMAAAALDRRCGYISLTPTTFESRLFGYMDANGKYVKTEFRECYEKGGVFIIDEMDNGSGNLYTALNGALENNICSFPDKQVKRHQEFVVIGTGNTSGGGPNPMFPTRRPFDKAFAERFTYLAWDYDIRLERTIAMSINKDVAPIWHEYLLTLRTYCRVHFPMVLVSPRATFKDCKYMRDGIMPIELMMDSIMFKGYDRDSVQKILNANPAPYNKLKEAILVFQENNRPSARKSSREVKRG